MRANNALSAEELDEGWILTCQVVPDERRSRRQLRRLTAESELGAQRREERLACGSATRCARRDRRPSGSTRTARSVTPASRKLLQPLDDRGLVAGGEEVADVGRVAVLEQPLVVRRVLGVPERPVRPRRARRRPRRCRTARRGRRRRRAAPVGPAAAAAFVMRGTTCSPIARSSAIQRIVPDASSPAMRSITGASAASEDRRRARCR